MDDRKLLELAAKAAGIVLIPYTWNKGAPWGEHHGFTVAGEGPNEWNPLEDDALALRLAVKLEIGVFPPADGQSRPTGGPCRRLLSPLSPHRAQPRAQEQSMDKRTTAATAAHVAASKRRFVSVGHAVDSYPLSAWRRLPKGVSLEALWDLVGPQVGKHMDKLPLWQVFCVVYFEGLAHGSAAERSRLAAAVGASEGGA